MVTDCMKILSGSQPCQVHSPFHHTAGSWREFCWTFESMCWNIRNRCCSNDCLL